MSGLRFDEDAERRRSVCSMHHIIAVADWSRRVLEFSHLLPYNEAMNSLAEHVVLVDEANQPLGTTDKATVHTDATPLHRGFSLFLFNSKGELLIQQRALTKKTWPGAWSNSVCGHPALDESPQAAAQRRLAYELGIKTDLDKITIALPDYRYQCERFGIVENEICPVMIAFLDVVPKPNPDEVNAIEWVAWDEFQKRMAEPNEFSEWCVEETALLAQNAAFQAVYDNFLTTPAAA